MEEEGRRGGEDGGIAIGVEVQVGQCWGLLCLGDFAGSLLLFKLGRGPGLDGKGMDGSNLVRDAVDDCSMPFQERNTLKRFRHNNHIIRLSAPSRHILHILFTSTSRQFSFVVRRRRGRGEYLLGTWERERQRSLSRDRKQQQPLCSKSETSILNN